MKMLYTIGCRCSPDEELFPNFEKSESGVLSTSFNAFQPTNLDDVNDVDVTFTCNVAVCKGACERVRTTCYVNTSVARARYAFNVKDF